jgi:gliding motility-associated-like protein
LVTAYTEHGCFNSQTYRVNIIPHPVIDVRGVTERCAGQEPFTLVASGAATYKWDGVVGEATFTSPSDVQRTVRVVGVTDGCESAPKEVTLTPLPLPVIEAITPHATICEGNETTLKVAGAYSYQWQGVSDDADYLLVSPVEDKVYTVRGVSEKGCYSDPIDIPVMVRYADQVKAHIEKIIACPGKPDSAIVVAEGALSYKWSSFPENEYVMNNQSDRLVVLYDTPTTITVEGTNEYACNSTAQVSLARMPVPTLEFKVEPEWIDAANPTVRLTGMAPNNEVTWWWNVGDGSALLQARDTMHTYQIEKFNQPFVVEVTAIDQYGCRFEGEAQVHIWKDVWSPTAFTPNGDGLNDVFGFYGVDEVEEFLFYIYNRLGEVVFEGHTADDTWDGTYQGKPCPWGVYGWVAQYRAVLNGVERQETLRGQVSIVK